jgi:hypothetical protein
MAIVIKEASNSPLALGQLAETLANTYLQHNQQKQSWDKFEQERIWKNEDRAQGQATYDAVQAADAAIFGGEPFKQSAAAIARDGGDISGYIPSTSTKDVPAHIYKNQQLNSYFDPNSNLTDAQRQAIDSQYSITKMKQDPMGLTQNAVVPALASTGANPFGGSLSASGEWSVPESSLGQAAGVQSATMGAGEQGVYTTKAGEVWTPAEIQAIAQQKGITPYRALQIIKQHDQ